MSGYVKSRENTRGGASNTCHLAG